MSKNLLIVESPAKSKTIEKYLGKDYQVLASFGHVRDLPKSKLGIDIENNFKPEYVTPTKAKKQLNLIKNSAEKATNVFLATDPDREGEAIAWHLAESIKNKNIKRIVFHEITKDAVLGALKNPRSLDKDLFEAQQARRLLDRLVGYNLSPLLWKKIKKGLSAGRVQSVALKMIIDREREIEAFKSQEYWEITALLGSKNGDLEALLIKKDDKNLEIKNSKEANDIIDEIKGKAFKVEKIQETLLKKTPPPPFTTSTLQQAAASKFGFTSKRTMMIAQQLYEGIEIGGKGSEGLITYMRTDSLNLSEGFKSSAKKFITTSFGQDYVTEKNYVYKKSKSSQEAHEAIRPTHIENTPEKIKGSLNQEQYKIYNLIFKRALASQMRESQSLSITVDVGVEKYLFRANGRILKFDGYLRAYPEKENQDKIIPKNLSEGDILKLKNLDPLQKFTQPPARLTEASLIKAMEENGIGRPSTYAPTISTLLGRKYILIEEKKIYPQEIGTIVNELLEKNFPFVVDAEFTAQMEEDLDKISEGKNDWVKILTEFWKPFSKDLKKGESDIERIKIPEKITDEVCEKCGNKMVIKDGRFGEFLACSNFPECRNTKPIVKKTGIICPSCDEGELIEKKTKKGRKFWGCERYPKCSYATWEDPKKTNNISTKNV